MKLALSMLEKVPNRRPCIDDIIDMFPKPAYRLKSSIDIENYNEYKKYKPKDEKISRRERDVYSTAQKSEATEGVQPLPSRLAFSFPKKSAGIFFHTSKVQS